MGNEITNIGEPRGTTGCGYDPERMDILAAILAPVGIRHVTGVEFEYGGLKLFAEEVDCRYLGIYQWGYMLRRYTDAGSSGYMYAAVRLHDNNQWDRMFDPAAMITGTISAIRTWNHPAIQHGQVEGIW